MRMRPKPPPPAVAPRKRGSRIEPRTASGEYTFGAVQRLDHPVNAQTYDRPEIEEPVSLPRNDVNAPNPFIRRTMAATETRRSMDMSELSPGGADRSFERPRSWNRTSLDVDAFKQLMLAGHATPPAPRPSIGISDSNASSASPCSRRSLSEPILEDRKKMDGSSAQVHGVGETTEANVELVPAPTPSGSLSRSSSTRVRPPPPKPRVRSGGRTSLSISTSPSHATSPSPINTRPLSFVDSDTPPPPPPPPQVKSPERQLQDEPEEIASPSPLPASKTQPVQLPSHPSASATEKSGVRSLVPPPPPPVRRSTSSSSRNIPRVSTTVRHANLNPPPPPPPRKQPNHSAEPEGGAALRETMSTKGEEAKKEEPVDHILVDLQKLQREVDELRGKYAGNAEPPDAAR